MVLLGVILALVGGQSLATVLGTLGVAGIIGLISNIAQLTPVAIEVLSGMHNAFKGFFESPAIQGALGQIGQGVEHGVIAQGLHQWAIENGDTAIKMQDQRDKDY